MIGKPELTEDEKRTRIASTDRIMVALLSLSAVFGIIFCDGLGFIDIEKWGYGAIGAWVTMILMFYFRKAGK